MNIPIDMANVFIADELDVRVDKQPDYRREKEAFQRLASQMVADPDGVVPAFVNLAMELTDGSSAGLSLLEDQPAPGVFRWHHLHGELSPFEGATTPRNYSPCGITLDRAGPVLCRHPERAYSWISDADIALAEVLLVPLYIGGEKPFGTLWITSQEDGHFRKDDARVASELADFIGMALRLRESDKAKREALHQQELLAHEMSHRVKNVFALVDSMVRLTAAGAASADDLSKSLSGRLRALAEAHSLVRRDARAAAPSTDLADLVQAIVKPYDFAGISTESRFVIEGAPVMCGPHGVNGLALLLHELATNAAKYGGLSCEGGRVSVTWEMDGAGVRIVWAELGGPIPLPPTKTGFGTSLVARTIQGQFAGAVEYSWLATGLVCTMTPSLARLSD